MIAVINNSVLVPNPKMLSIVLKINTAIKITISHISRITQHVVSRYKRLG